MHNIAYMMDPIAEAEIITLILSCSIGFERHYFLLRVMLYNVGKKPYLESCILNRFNTLSIYASWLNHINLFDLSL
jgi:hypothetical protein